jgi:predicted acylesterase/phospholipase RssA
MLGALEALQSEGAEGLEVFAGTSAGSIVAFLAALKTIRARDELEYMLAHPPQRLRLLSINNLLSRFGLDDGRKLFAYLAGMLEALAEGSSRLTFEQLFERTGSVLRVTATCTTTSTLETFDRVSHPRCVVMDAIRASCCVPLYFAPHRIGAHSYVDGGLLAYYPHGLLADIPKEERLAVFVAAQGRGPDAAGSGMEALAAYVYRLSCIACTARDAEAVYEARWILMLPPDERCGGWMSVNPEPSLLSAAFEGACDAASPFIRDRLGTRKRKND